MFCFRKWIKTNYRPKETTSGSSPKNSAIPRISLILFDEMLYNKHIESDVTKRRKKSWLKKKEVIIMKNFEIVENSSTFDKWSLDRLVNGFLDNDGNLPAWAVGILGNISLYFPRDGFGNFDIVADWRDGFILTVYVFPFDKNSYKYLPKDYATCANALPVRVVEIFSDEIANLNNDGDVDVQYNAFIAMVFEKIAELEKEGI